MIEHLPELMGLLTLGLGLLVSKKPSSRNTVKVKVRQKGRSK